MRHLDGQLTGLGVQHLNWQLGGDFLTKAILSLEHRAVGSNRQFQGEIRLAALVGGKTLGGKDPAQFP